MPIALVLLSILSCHPFITGRTVFVARLRTSDIMALASKYGGLGGLNRAMYVMQCLDRGKTRSQVVEDLQDDGKLVDAWISFLMQYDWIVQQNESDRWLVTPRGREWAEKINRILVKS